MYQASVPRLATVGSLGVFLQLIRILQLGNKLTPHLAEP